MWQSPTESCNSEKQFTLNKSSTPDAVLEEAYKAFKIEEMRLPLARLRLRRLRGRLPDEPWSNNTMRLGDIYSGYGHLSLMLECSRDDGTFEEYDPDGTILECYTYMPSSLRIVKSTITVPAQSTVGDLRRKVADQAGISDLPRVLLVRAKNSTWTTTVEKMSEDSPSLQRDLFIYSGSKVSTLTAKFRLFFVSLIIFPMYAISLMSQTMFLNHACLFYTDWCVCDPRRKLR